MIIFTPNTVIRSTEVNSNFNEIDGRIDNLEAPIYAYGNIVSGTGAGVRGLNISSYSGVQFINGNTIKILTKGIYFIHAQQLVQNDGAGALYWSLYASGMVVRYGYINTSVFTDAIVSELKEFDKNMELQIYYSKSVANSWEGPHSAFQLFCIKRT